MNSQQAIADYYQRRAAEYDRIYSKPEQQKDFNTLRSWLAQNVADKTVLEVACGTGYWTAVAASAAKSIVATDINAGPLEIARGRGLGARVRFEMGDAYQLEGIMPAFDCGLATFWCSHVPKTQLAVFLQSFAYRLKKSGHLLLIDSKWVDGYRKPPSRSDEEGNTYQTRTLDDGSTFEVLKNFLSRDEVEQAVQSFSIGFEWLELEYLWAAKVVVRP